MGITGIFLTAFVVGFSGAMMPGPLLTVTINESIRRGAKAGPLLIVGHAILELILIIGLIFGLSLVIQKPAVTAFIGLAGGGFLLWMGTGMVKSAWKGTVSLDFKATGEKKGLDPILAGILVSISNPYWSLWWATIGLGYLVIAQKLGYWGVAAFFIGHILSDFLWYGLVSGAVAGGRRFLSNKVYRGLMAGCGVFLLWLALAFVSDGLKHFTSIGCL